MLVFVKRIAVLALVLASLGCLRARAAVNIDKEIEDIAGVEALRRAAGELEEEIDVAEGFDYDKALRAIFGDVLEKGSGMLKAAIGGAVLIIICSYLCSTVQCAFPEASGYISLAGIAAVTLIFSSNDSGLIRACEETLRKMQDFANVLLPVLAASAAAAGEVSSAAVKYEAAALFFNILTNLAAFALIPLVYAFLAASVAEAATGSRAVAGAAALLKWLGTMLLTGIMLAFVFYLSVGAIVSGSADAAAVRVAKTTISTAFPVVGNIASDAASALLASALVIKNTVGAAGLTAVLALCAVPFVETGLRYLLFKAASKLAAESEDGSLQRLIARFSEAFGLLVAVIGASAVMMFFAVFSFMKIASI